MDDKERSSNKCEIGSVLMRKLLNGIMILFAIMVIIAMVLNNNTMDVVCYWKKWNTYKI